MTPSPRPTLPVVVVDGPGANTWEIIGALGGAAGVLLAVYLAWRGADQVRRERRIIHELDVLRDLADRASELAGGGHRKARLRGPLLTLVDPHACPVLRVFTDANPTPGGEKEFDDLLNGRYPSWSPELIREALQPDQVWSAIEPTCVAEIETAIRARLHDRSKSRSRLGTSALSDAPPDR